MEEKEMGKRPSPAIGSKPTTSRLFHEKVEIWKSEKIEVGLSRVHDVDTRLPIRYCLPQTGDPGSVRSSWQSL